MYMYSLGRECLYGVYNRVYHTYEQVNTPKAHTHIVVYSYSY